MKFMASKKVIGVSVLTGFVAMVAMAGCSLQTGSSADAWNGSGTVSQVERDAVDFETPMVVTDEDGASYQRTPSDTARDGNLGAFFEDYPNNYNIRFYDADDRGCYACHDDLAETCNDMDYDHIDLTNGYGIQPTVQMCLDCHTVTHGYVEEEQGFGSMMHAIHKDERSVDCMSCHFATEDGNGMQLWDEVKYGWLRGIDPIENVQGEFSFTQDSVRHRADGDNLADFLVTRWAGWLDFGQTPGDVDSFGVQGNDRELDQETFDNWTITITGAVDNEMTWTLPELIEEAPSEDVTLKMHCVYNPLGGPLISNCEVRGIPLSWLFEQAGIRDDAYGFTAVSAYLAQASEEFELGGNAYEFATLLESNEDDEAYLVYMLDGTDLSWSEGYPVAIWTAGYNSAGASVKQLSDIIVYDEEGFNEMTDLYGDIAHGWSTHEASEGLAAAKDAGLSVADRWLTEQDGWYVNKPNVGLFDNREGRILTVGEPYAFEGFADSFNNEITAIEFSMDGGNTWTSYATEGATDDRWVNWKFEYTPEQVGSYVLQIRAKNVTGLTTPEPIEFMFNVESDGEGK